MPAAPPILRAVAHIALEAIAYFVGFRLYLLARRRSGDALPDSTRWTVIAAAAVGAVVGSKLLYWVEDPAATAAHWLNPDYLLGGKTIVGGLVGGLIAVELRSALSASAAPRATCSRCRCVSASPSDASAA
jgi:phosphatidylglycerol:prolipoprotein diacylglycerol transferase